jgi:hypothetical protein
VSKGKCLN